MVTPSFEIVRPPSGDSPIVVEVPHAGMGLDAQSADWISPRLGATLIVAQVSRMVVDLNRAADDYDGVTVRGGPERNQPRGVVWRLTSDGHAVQKDRLPQAELERRLDAYHRPYHEAVRHELDAKRDRFGFAVMLCAHSMPTPRALPRRGATPDPPTDLVPGTRGGSSAGYEWIELVDRCGRDQGYSVKHDDPYRGGFSTAHYGRPDEHFHVLQLEIARRLYMDEGTLAPDPTGFERVAALADLLVARLVEHGTARAQRRGGVT
ncbi:MAG: N-formylglutamate amidohydrolase [Deltaproteobacteria bacterium]|nr:N-formylglutamate amidohydrolase [Deltaproteobacteria bacterium]